MALRRRLRVALALLPLICAGCVSGSGAPSGDLPAAAMSGIAAQPGTDTYTCADGGMMTIQNLGRSLRVLGPDGVEEDLPASPADQHSRYGGEHDAIVIDGAEALVMKRGEAPLTCTR